MGTYLLINGAIIVVPLLLLFERKVEYYKKLPRVMGSAGSVGCIYILWDIVATHRGDWSFNPNYVIGFSLFGLPFEEFLFFITVPFSCIFIYESISVYIKDRSFIITRIPFVIIVLMLWMSGFLTLGQPYTATVFYFTGAFFLIVSFINFSLLQSVRFWIYIAITIIPFFVVNYFLTSLPVVIYNPDAILGTRITTIPIEDFFYSFSLLSFYILVYKAFGNVWTVRKK
jgi:lycopene cyclase domain-containing protein